MKHKPKLKISKLFIHILFIILAMLCIIPLLAVISISLSTETELAIKGYSILPQGFTTRAYEIIFKSPAKILNGYMISIFVTFGGGLISLIICSLLAYPMSRKDFKLKKPLVFYVFFTMLFGGGLIPWYIMIVNMRLNNNILVLILPYLVIPINVLLLRTYFIQVPMSIVEAAKIDGCDEFRNFIKIIMPLSKPALATIGLFIVLWYWNDWYLGLLFLTKPNLFPLQLMLYNMMSNAQYIARTVNLGSYAKFPAESVRMAMCICAAGPALFIFPFFQKYFVKGLTVGSLKE